MARVSSAEAGRLAGERRQWEGARRRIVQTLFGLVSHAILVVATVLIAMPFAWMLSTALKPLPDVFIFPPVWIPPHPQWQNFVAAWNASIFGRFYINSAIVTVAIVSVQVINVTMAAYAFSWLRFPGRDTIFLLFLATMMIPAQVTIVPVFITLTWLGWIDTYAALIVPFMGSAFGTFLIRQMFLSLPSELIDAAKLDGAGHFRTLWSVMIPLSVPMIVTFVLLSFMYHWNDYFFPLIVTTSLHMRTLPIGLTLFEQADAGTDWNLLMAAAIFVMAPIMILFLVAQRQFIQGIARTGLNG